MRRTLAVVAGLGLGLLFSQFPEYAQQYEQRLGGAVDELRTIVADFDSDAQRFGLTRQEALARYAISSDGFLVGRGLSMDRTLARYDRLSQSLADLEAAGPLDRVAHLRDYLDSDVGSRALAAFRPGVPVTPEGLAWGAAGLLIGYLALYPLFGLATLPFRWRRGRTPHKRVPLSRRDRLAAVPAEPALPPVPAARLARARREPVPVAAAASEPIVATPAPEVAAAAPAPSRRRPPERAMTQREIDERIVREI